MIIYQVGYAMRTIPEPPEPPPTKLELSAVDRYAAPPPPDPVFVAAFTPGLPTVGDAAPPGPAPAQPSVGAPGPPP